MFASVRAAFNILVTRRCGCDFRRWRTSFDLPKSGGRRRRAAGAERAEETRREPATFEAADTVPRRVPVPALRPPLGLCIN
jgi:hypothetical protein